MVKISENKQTKKTQIVLLKKYKDQLNKLKDVQHHNHQVNTHQNYSKMQFHILTNCWFKPWKSQMLAEMWRGLFNTGECEPAESRAEPPKLNPVPGLLYF